MMRKIFVYFVPIFSLVFLLGVSVHAEGHILPSQVQSVSSDRQEKIISSINITSLSEKEKHSKILCFDVNSYGCFAIGFDSIPRKVCIFNKSGVYQYGFSFLEMGTYGVTLTDSSVFIHLVRPNLCIEITPEIEVLNITEIPPVLENNAYWRAISSKSEQELYGKTYSIQDNSKLVCVDANGNIDTLFAVEKNLHFIVLMPVAFLAMAFGVISVSLKVLLKKKKNL